LIHSVYTKCENGCVFAKLKQTIGYHYGSAVYTQVKKLVAAT